MKGGTVQSDVTYQFNQGLSAGFNHNFLLCNSLLGKKLSTRQQAEIKLYAFDLLGQNNSIQVNNTAPYTEDVQTNILQRYLLLMFTHSIRSFAGPSPTDALPGGRRGPSGFGQPGGDPAPGGGI